MNFKNITLATFSAILILNAQAAPPIENSDRVAIIPILDGTERISAPDLPEYFDTQFGQSVAVINGQVAVTIPDFDPGLPIPFNNNFGQVEIYDIQSSQLRETLLPDTASLNQRFGRRIGANDQYAWVTSYATPSVIDVYDAQFKNHLIRIELEDSESVIATSGFDNKLCAVLNSPNQPTRSIAVLFDLSDGSRLATFEHGSMGGVDTATQSVAMNTHFIAILSMDLNEDMPYTSPARVDVYNANTFELEYTIRPVEPSIGFGMNIAFNSSYIAIGNPYSSGGSDATRFGNVELYDQANGQLVWRFVTGNTDLQFANSIAMNERFVAVGSMWTNRVYLIDIHDPDRPYKLGDHQQLFGTGSRFGSSLSMDEDWLAVGTPGIRSSPTVMLYKLGCRASLADMNGDGRNTFADVAEFLRLLSESDPRIDLNGDGIQNYFDITLYLELFYERCL